MSSAQKIIKYLAMAFAACLTIAILGGILNAVIGIVGAFVPEHHQEQKGNETETAVEQIDSQKSYTDVENLEIESSVYKIDIIGDSKVEGVKVECSNIPSTYKVYYEDGTLKTTDDNWASGLFNKNASRAKGRVKVYVSDKINLDKVDVEMGVGAVTIANVSMEDLEVDCGIGAFSCENVVADNAIISGGVGNVECDNVTFDGLELDGGVGDVSIQGTLTGKTEISAGMGKVDLDVNGKKGDYNVKVETGLGSIYVDGEKYSDSNSYNNSESNLIDIEGGIGTIHVDFK